MTDCQADPASAPSSHRLALPTETDPGRKAVADAIRRLLDGTPQRVPAGRLSVVALATEADVPRNHLNRRYADLRDHFVAATQRAHAENAVPVSPARVAELEATLAEQKEAMRELQENRRAWKEAATVFIRKNQTLLLEVQNARRQTDVLQRRVHSQDEQIEALRQQLRDAGQVTSLRPSGPA